MKMKCLGLWFMVATILLSGCEKAGPSESVDGETSQAVVQSAYEEPTVEAAEASLVKAGGYPWLNTNLKENLSEDMELSPKDDFYLYVNYDWLMNTEIPDGYAAISRRYDHLEKDAQDFYAILSDESIQGHDIDLMRSILHLALDWDARNADGIQPMMKTIEDIRGISNLDELKEFLCDPDRMFKVEAFVEFENVIRGDDTSRYLFLISPAQFILGEPEEYEKRTDFGDRAYEAYKDFVVEMLLRAGYDENEAIKVYEAAIELEGMMAKGMKKSESCMLYEQISDKTAWYETKFPIAYMLDAYGYAEAETCVCKNRKYMENLERIYKTKNLDKIKSYLTVKFVMNASLFLDQESNAAHSKCSDLIYGRAGDDSYETRMYNGLLTSYWGDLMTRVYLLKRDAAAEKERLTVLCKQVIDGYRIMLQGEEWLSEETKAKAIEKLDNIVIQAGYPEELRNYDSVDVNGLNYWEFGKLNSRLKREADVALTNGRVDRTKWTESALSDNGTYNNPKNAITIPLAILFGDWYYEDISDEELYASVGTVIGHEISHAFDAVGATRDKDGQSDNWWTDADKKAFDGKMEELQNFYKGMTVWEGAHVQAEKICDEACADIGGLKVILEIAKTKENFDYDKFFRAYAESERYLSSAEYLEYQYLMDVHLLSFLRVNSVLQQFEEFMETYDVKEGDRMYLAPEDRVQVW